MSNAGNNRRGEKGVQGFGTGRNLYHNRIGNERLLAQIQKLAEAGDYSSLEEMNDAINQKLMQHGQLSEMEPETPLERAQELVYRAYEAVDGEERVELARKALEETPECLDAYVILAEEELDSPQEKAAYLRRAAEIGEESLGEDFFEEHRGRFWGLLETRPYMRVLRALAVELWHSGESGEAVDILLEMLELNPGDNQGVRYELTTYLMLEDRDREAGEILFGRDIYDDNSAFWLYNQAINLFRREGRSKTSNARLQEALDNNPHVPDFLLGRNSIPAQGPPFYTLGDESEGVAYVLWSAELWLQTEGALEWLAAEEGRMRVREMLASDAGNKVRRNDPCPCGSGRKFKYCCGA